MNALEPRPPFFRACIASRMLVLALGLGLPLVGASAAPAKLTQIGPVVQSNGQGSSVNQAGQNIANPLPTPSGSPSNVNNSLGKQTALSTLTNGQAVDLGTGGVIQGGSKQGSTQANLTAQAESGSRTETNAASGQLANAQVVGGGSGGIVLGDSAQSNKQSNGIGQSIAGSKNVGRTGLTPAVGASVDSRLINGQVIGDIVVGNATAIIIGASAQDSSQADTTAQAVAQKESNPRLSDSKLVDIISTTAALSNVQGVLATTLIGTALQGSMQGHTGTQSTSQAPSGLIVGNFLPSSSDTNKVTGTNCQLVADTLLPCRPPQ